ncbi:MAG: DUF2076 family protein [Buchnera aphidicola (Floraphis choui)]
MNNNEKQLIESLFSRLHKTEIESSDRDNVAEKLIKDLLEKYPNSPYYMAQTILIQETAIKKLNEQISLLDSKSDKNQKDKKDTSSTGFLSSLFGSKKTQNVLDSHSNNTLNKPYNKIQDSNVSSFPSQVHSSAIPQSGTINNTNGFLSGALQTAAGVAGGVVMANMLMNLFQNKKPEEEIIDAVHHIDSSHTGLNSTDSDPIHSQYISDNNSTHVDDNIEDYNRSDYDVSDDDDCNAFEDDNFI